MKSDEVATLLGAIMALTLLVAVVCFKIWLWGSLITSSVKSVSDKCGTTYGIEGSLISGDWFCSK